MRPDMLTYAIGHIGEDLIAEGQDDLAFRQACRRQMSWYRYAMAAACLLLVCLCLPLAWHMTRDSAGGNVAPPPGEMNGTFGDNFSTEDQTDMYAAISLVSPQMPYTGPLTDALVLQFSMVVAGESYDGVYACTEAEGFTISNAQIPLGELQAGADGRLTFSVSLSPTGACTQGEIVCTVLGKEQALLEQRYTYRIEGEWIFVSKAA